MLLAMPSMNAVGKAGMCVQCAHAERIVGAKGSMFLLCGLSRTDLHFAKYPRLPVLSCRGYSSGGEGGERTGGRENS